MIVVQGTCIHFGSAICMGTHRAGSVKRTRDGGAGCLADTMQAVISVCAAWQGALVGVVCIAVHVVGGS